MKIYAPVKDANGLYASVMFVNGVGETDNPTLIKWFKEHGYKVPINDCEETPKAVSHSENESLDFEAMTPDELRNWMRDNGYGGKIKNTKNKDKLLDILRG